MDAQNASLVTICAIEGSDTKDVQNASLVTTCAIEARAVMAWDEKRWGRVEIFRVFPYWLLIRYRLPLPATLIGRTGKSHGVCLAPGGVFSESTGRGLAFRSDTPLPRREDPQPALCCTS